VDRERRLVGQLGACEKHPDPSVVRYTYGGIGEGVAWAFIMRDPRCTVLRDASTAARTAPASRKKPIVVAAGRLRTDANRITAPEELKKRRGPDAEAIA
jgi:hypothetical protein